MSDSENKTWADFSTEERVEADDSAPDLTQFLTPAYGVEEGGAEPAKTTTTKAPKDADSK